MKLNKYYLVVLNFLIIFCLVLFILLFFNLPKTNAKYTYSVNLSNNINVGYISFDLVPDNSNIDTITENETLTLKYKLKNFKNNLVNGANLKYYIKILDMSDNELAAENAIISNYNYIYDEIDNEIINKGYGSIILASDGVTSDEKEIVLNINYNNLNNNDLVRFKIRIIAENVFTDKIEKIEDYSYDLVYTNGEDEQDQNSNIEEDSNDNNSVNIYSES